MTMGKRIIPFLSIGVLIAVGYLLLQMYRSNQEASPATSERPQITRPQKRETPQKQASPSSEATKSASPSAITK